MIVRRRRRRPSAGPCRRARCGTSSGRWPRGRRSRCRCAARGRTVGRAEHLPLRPTAPPADADDVATAARGGRPGRPGPGQLAGSTSSSAGSPRGCSAACSPRRPSPTTPRSSCATGRPCEAAEVGGDWYDAFLQPSGATVLVIGDVVGPRHRGGGRDGPAARDAARHRLPRRGRAGRRPRRAGRRDRGARHGHDGHRGDRPDRADAGGARGRASRGCAGRTPGTRRRWCCTPTAGRGAGRRRGPS